MTGVCQAPPEQAEQDGGNQSVVRATHFGEREAHPANFFEETRDKAESDTDEKTVGCKHGETNVFMRKRTVRTETGGMRSTAYQRAGTRMRRIRENRSCRPILPSMNQVKRMQEHGG